MYACSISLTAEKDLGAIGLEEMSDWDFSRMRIVMSVKPSLTELLKVNSALKPILFVIEVQCIGGQ